MKKLLLVAFITAASLATYAGAYRHDVPAEKYLSLAKEPQFDCVGQVFDKQDHGGSCVLISDRFVLTAAHVLIETDNVADTMTIDGRKVTMYKATNERVVNAADVTIRFKRTRYGVKRIVLFPEYLKDKKRIGDLALIELEEPVPGIQPAILNAQFDELHSIATGVGFGASGPANKPEEVDLFMEKIAGQNTIDTLTGELWNGRPIMLGADFDKAGDNCCNSLGSAKPTPLEYGTCGGDSGGPLFRLAGKEWQVIGICVGGGVNLEKFMKYGYYGQNEEWLRVSVFYEWIAENMKTQKQAPK